MAITLTYPRVHSFDDANDWPSYRISDHKIVRMHIDAGSQLVTHTTTYDIFDYAGDQPASIERVVDDIEAYFEDYTAENLITARVVSISTDEGLLAPYALATITVIATWSYNAN